jgi:hypothetical protein
VIARNHIATSACILSNERAEDSYLRRMAQKLGISNVGPQLPQVRKTKVCKAAARTAKRYTRCRKVLAGSKISTVLAIQVPHANLLCATMMRHHQGTSSIEHVSSATMYHGDFTHVEESKKWSGPYFLRCKEANTSLSGLRVASAISYNWQNSCEWPIYKGSPSASRGMFI